MKIRILIFAFAVTASLPALTSAQSYSGDDAGFEPVYLVDKPTAGILKRGAYSLYGNFFQNGGMLGAISVGVFDGFSFGISYGGNQIIGNQKITMNPTPGVSVKLRLFSEEISMPAIAIGFDSQGKEAYLDSTSRYTVKSPGFYVVASKNWSFLGFLSGHAGINYTLERSDDDRDANLFVGIEKSIGSTVSFVAEYDFAINDNKGKAIGTGKGYMNVGIRWSWGKGFHVGFDLKDVLKNNSAVVVGNRVLNLEYIQTF